MGGVNVKNTIVERVLQIIAPHLCSGCGKTGSVLCNHCKYDIVNEPFLGCILCMAPQRDGICTQHNSPISRAFVVGLRNDTLEILINRLKFERMKAVASALTSLLDERLPILPPSIQVVPVPTAASHIRKRGYDQVAIIARQLAMMRGYTYTPALLRRANYTQHTVDRNTRLRQAESAFRLDISTLSRSEPVLLIDDIITTGSTVQAAASLLHENGFTIWVGALAYQPLD